MTYICKHISKDILSKLPNLADFDLFHTSFTWFYLTTGQWQSLRNQGDKKAFVCG